MKKIVLLMLVLVLGGCRTQEEPETDQPYCSFNSDECLSDSDEYEAFIKDSDVFIEITMQEAIDMFENQESGILYFGFPDCPWCLEALPIMEEAAKENGKDIYYVRTRDDERNLIYTDEEKSAILSYVGQFEDTDDEGNAALFVPLVVTVKDGEAISGHVGTVEGHDAHERVMSQDEQDQLKKIYVEMFSE